MSGFDPEFFFWDFVYHWCSWVDTCISDNVVVPAFSKVFSTRNGSFVFYIKQICFWYVTLQSICRETCLPHPAILPSLRQLVFVWFKRTTQNETGRLGFLLDQPRPAPATWFVCRPSRNPDAQEQVWKHKIMCISCDCMHRMHQCLRRGKQQSGEDQKMPDAKMVAGIIQKDVLARIHGQVVWALVWQHLNNLEILNRCCKFKVD